MILGHESLIFFAAIVIQVVVAWFVWRFTRSLDRAATPPPAPDGAAHDRSAASR
jgi:hypothetical protein